MPRNRRRPRPPAGRDDIDLRTREDIEARLRSRYDYAPEHFGEVRGAAMNALLADNLDQLAPFRAVLARARERVADLGALAPPPLRKWTTARVFALHDIVIGFDDTGHQQRLADVLGEAEAARARFAEALSDTIFFLEQVEREWAPPRGGHRGPYFAARVLAFNLVRAETLNAERPVTAAETALVAALIGLDPLPIRSRDDLNARESRWRHHLRWARGAMTIRDP